MKNSTKKQHTLGSYLKLARQKKRLSAIEVSGMLGLDSPLRILSWERNQGRALPLATLKKLIPIYGLDVQVVFDLLLQYQITRLEQKFKRLIGEVE